MNFSLIISLIFLSASHINARLIDKSQSNYVSLFNKDAPGPLGNLIIRQISDLVKRAEFFAGWNGNESFRYNLINMIDAPLKAKRLPVRDPDASIETNLIAEIKFILTVVPLPAFDSSKTVTENVAGLVNSALDLTPIPIFIFRDQIKAKIGKIAVTMISLIPGFDVSKSPSANIVNWVKAILKIAKVDPDKSTVENVNQLLNTTLDVIKLPGFNPEKSLDENVNAILVAVFTNLPF